ncbi:MAG: M20/M25/M40 family metallo-hydrolase [Clostridia bacterium]|nr:M20/M25/M40 family metallo-hydrolase [Clostridia bacterium]
MNIDRLLNRFMDYVRCDSESRDELGFCEKLEAELRELGMEVRRDGCGSEFGSNGFNIYARMDGRGDPLLFCAHMDTVAPGKGINPVVEDGVIRSDGSTVLGADDKSGVAAIMEALASLADSGDEHRTVEVLFTISEEVGLLGSKNADYSPILSRSAVVLDSSSVGCIINNAPATVRISARVHGRSAHAAVAPKTGAHALKAACAAIAAMPCGYVGDDTVMNVGTMACPGKTNIVPALAEFDMEIRSFSQEELEARIAQSEAALREACAEFGTTYEFIVDRQTEVLYVDPTSPIVEELRSAFVSLGRTPRVERTYGGSDATWLHKNGIAALNVGTGMQAVHGVSEHIAIADLADTARLVERLMR